MENQKGFQRIRSTVLENYLNTSDEEVLIDVLTDLMHFAEHSGPNYSGAFRTAYGHFVAEDGNSTSIFSVEDVESLASK